MVTAINLQARIARGFPSTRRKPFTEHTLKGRCYPIIGPYEPVYRVFASINFHYLDILIRLKIIIHFKTAVITDFFRRSILGTIP